MSKYVKDIEEAKMFEIRDEELEGVSGGSGKNSDIYYHIGCPNRGTLEYTAAGCRCTGCNKKFKNTNEFSKNI